MPGYFEHTSPHGHPPVGCVPNPVPPPPNHVNGDDAKCVHCQQQADSRMLKYPYWFMCFEHVDVVLNHPIAIANSGVCYTVSPGQQH